MCCSPGDAWLFDTVKLQWRQLVVEDRPRLWHTVSYSEDEDILVFGGCSSNILSATEAMVKFQAFFRQ